MNDRPHRWALLGVAPPAPAAGKVERLRFVRDLQLRWLPINVIGLAAVALVGVGLTPLIVVAASTLVLILDAAWLTVTIRRATKG
jgi:hypothetical protein